MDREALTLYLRYNYVPAPWSIYRGIYKLPPAHYVVVRDKGTVVSEPHCYWDLGEIAEKGVAQAQGDVTDLIDELESLLGDAIGRRMAADVPLGAFLSGGYDSTLVTALMQAQSDRPVRTFSIGFHEAAYNEAEHAKAVAGHLGTDHTELYVKPEEAIRVIPELPFIWDEPFADPSQIPTYLVTQLARQHVTVSLSGDGGDELFFGYDRYLKGQLFERLSGSIPLIVQRLTAAGLSRIPGGALEWLGKRLPNRFGMFAFGYRLRKLGEVLGISDPEAFYQRLVSLWKAPAELVQGGQEPATLLDDRARWPVLPGLCERMMYFDMMSYLPDDILTKVDRASMAVSLEARVPLLDHRLVEFAWNVPTSLKIRNGQGKWLLREVLYRYVPRQLMDRPKMGFGVPIEHWLRGPLRDWAESMLDEKRLRDESFFDPEPIRRMWHEHTTGQRQGHYYLWNILMFQSWLESTK
jgi:asparagine synthase (glutamine-hydrolysing)